MAAAEGRGARLCGRWLLLVILLLAPWPLGCAGPSAQLVLVLSLYAVAALAVLVVLEENRRPVLGRDGVLWCLLGLTVWTWLQRVPLPEGVVAVLSPQAAAWHRQLRPVMAELLPGEPGPPATRPGWLPLSVAPHETERLGWQLALLCGVYVAVRLLAGSGRWFRTVSAGGLALGVALALFGIVQYLSGERERLYGRFATDGPAFGPFVNKNHFAFQLTPLLGLGLGWGLSEWRRQGLRSAAAVGASLGCGLMLAALVLCQSRGGLIAALLGLLTVMVATARSASLRLAVACGVPLLLLLTAAGLILWLGQETTYTRLASLWEGTADNRTPVWRRAWPLVGQFPLVGVGGGAYTVAEWVLRRHYEGSFISTSAHSEYLQAWIEGGPLRLLLTLGLAGGAITAALRAYRRQEEVLWLGAVFAVTAAAVHSVGDCGLQVPSVAMTLTIIAASAAAAGSDPTDTTRQTRPGPMAAGADGIVTPTTGAIGPDVRRERLAGSGVAVAVLGGGLVVAALAGRDYLADRWQSVAAMAGSLEEAVSSLERAGRWQSYNPEPWEQLAAVWMSEGVERNRRMHQAVAGGSVAVWPSEFLVHGDGGGALLAAARASRAARDALPLWPGPHLRLAALAHLLTLPEPASVHLIRAQQVGAADPDVWFVCGQIAAVHGQLEEALRCWRQSLQLSPRQLPVIVRTAGMCGIPPERLRREGLPDDPLLWHAAMRHLFPVVESPEVRPWWAAIAAHYQRVGELTAAADYRLWAEACEHMGEYGRAEEVWRRGIERFPDDRLLRDGWAARLEQEERFAEALPHLEWLAERYSRHGEYPRRLAAARRAVELKQLIDGR